MFVGGPGAHNLFVLKSTGDTQSKQLGCVDIKTNINHPTPSLSGWDGHVF
jgi:hypothetical protein